MKNGKWKTYLTWILPVLLVLLLLLYAIPLPRQMELKLSGVEISPDGTVIETGEMVISGKIYNYILQGKREFRLEELALPNREVGKINKLTPTITDTGLGFSYTQGWFELPEYTSDWNTYIASILIASDESYWIVEVTDRIFIGTVSPDADYAAILEQCGDLLNG